MKTYLNFLRVVLLTIFAASNLSAQQTDNAMRAKIDSRSYTIDVNRVAPMSGRAVMLTPGYTLRVVDDSMIVQLPYYGRATNMAYTSNGGSMRFTSMIRDYAEREREKGAIILSMSAEDGGESFDFQLTCYPNGTADIRVQSDKRDPITYRGTFREK